MANETAIATLPAMELEGQVSAQSAQKRARGAALARSLNDTRTRAATTAAAVRARLARASLKAQGAARRSATISGLLSDLKRAGRWLETSTPQGPSSLKELREDLALVRRTIANDFSTLRRELPHEVARMRQGLSTESGRIARRMKEAGEHLKRRAAH